MVDSGAKRSAIAWDLIKDRNSFPIKESMTNWRVADGGPARGVCGEITMTVSYRGHIVELPRVVVMKHQSAPFILGIEWIDAMRALVGTQDQKGMVFLPEDKERLFEWTNEKEVMLTESSICPAVLLPQKVKVEYDDHFSEAVNLNVQLEGPARDWQLFRNKVRSRTMHARTPQYLKIVLDADPSTLAEEKRRMRKSRRSPFFNNPVLVNIDEAPLYEEFITSHSDKRSDWIDMEIGAIIEEPTKPFIRAPPRSVLKSIKGQTVPARHRAFINFETPGGIKSDQWLISAANGEAKGGQWASPSCIVNSYNGVVEVPISNGGDRSVGWSYFRGRLVAVPFKDQSVVDCGTDDKVWESLANIEPDWYNNPEDIFEPNIDPGLTDDQREQVMTVLWNHRRLFAKKKGLTHLVEHYINTGDAKPVRTTPSRGSPTQRALIRDLVQKMCDEDVAEASNSPWASRVVLAPKPNGGVRFCVDFRSLNLITLKDNFPLPVMEDLINHLDGATYFSCVDLESGFWQIGVAEVDRLKTSFVTADGQYQFKRLPFGLQASPPNFQRLMNYVLGDLRWLECLCYLDDILIFGKTFEQHLERLNRVLQAIGDAGLTLNPKKCVFGTRCVKFLGHLIDVDGIHPNPEKVQAIKDFPKPMVVTSLRGFIGMASWYRKFILGFAEMARPLHDLLKKRSRRSKGLDGCS